MLSLVKMQYNFRMIPQLIIFKNRITLDQYINQEIKKFHINFFNITKIEPLKEKGITVDQIREITKIFKYVKKEISLIIFYDFDKANIEAQNALLKTLEEQATNNLILLAVRNLNKLLPTIISRTRVIYLNKSQPDFEYQKKEVAEVEKILLDPNLTSHFTNSFFEVTTKERAIYLLLIIIKLTRKFFFKIKQKNNRDYSLLSEIIKEGLNLINLIENNNINPQLALDNYLILIKKEIMIDRNAKNNESF